MNHKNAIALTGGIATGKSTVASIFHEFGYDIIDADKIAHKALDDNCNAVAKLFGSQYCLGDSVDRVALGNLVFKDKAKLKMLENLLHPIIHQEVISQAEKLDKESKKYLIDLPLFFETERYPIRNVIVVYTSKDIQLRRLMLRDNMKETEALKRIESQIDIEIKKQKATYVIDNSSDREHLLNECKRVERLIDMRREI